MAVTDNGREEFKSARQRAAAAAFLLVGAPPMVHAASEGLDVGELADHWTMDSSFLRYTEAERITVLEPQFGVKREFADNRSLGILVTVDTITGATPLGTLPATGKTAPNTVTSPSGRGTNPIIGKIPLSNMTDTRYGVDAAWQQPMGSDLMGSFGASASKETDYRTVGGSMKVAQDFNQKNTTLSFGFAPEFDVSSPNGGLPKAYSVLEAPDSIHGTRDTKWLASGQLGLTQIITKRMLMQFNYTFTREQGYLNDPYKLLSVTNATGDPLWSVYERRPGSRNEHSFYWLTKYDLWAQNVLSLGLRFYGDTWGVHSQTIDFGFRRQSTARFYWEPHIRYYHQSAADFYRLGLLNTGPSPEYVSSDLRLANLDGLTYGIQFGYTFQNGSLFIVRAEYYWQTGESYPNGAVGVQRSFDLFPTLFASILQVEYRCDPARFLAKKEPVF